MVLRMIRLWSWYGRWFGTLAVNTERFRVWYRKLWFQETRFEKLLKPACLVTLSSSYWKSCMILGISCLKGIEGLANSARVRMRIWGLSCRIGREQPSVNATRCQLEVHLWGPCNALALSFYSFSNFSPPSILC